MIMIFKFFIKAKAEMSWLLHFLQKKIVLLKKIVVFAYMIDFVPTLAYN